MNRLLDKVPRFFLAALGGWLLLAPLASRAQTPQEILLRSGETPRDRTAEDYNRRLRQLQNSLAEPAGSNQAEEYRIGANDLVDINVFQAPELNRSLRVSAGGEIFVPLVGAVPAAGLAARELEKALESRLGAYMKNPRVGVFVSSIESHAISVLGAVKKPGVFQVRGPRSVLEMLSLAEGITDDAGHDLIVMRGAGLAHNTNSPSEPGDSDAGSSSRSAEAAHATQTPPAPAEEDRPEVKQTVRISLKDLLESEDPLVNVPVYPGDIVKVTRAGIVYVVGEVKKPGGFVLRNDEGMSVLKAIALAEGLTPISSKSHTQIIRADSAASHRQEMSIDLGKIFAGKAPDPALSPGDIVFVPRSGGRTVLSRGSEAAFAAVTGLLIFRW